MKPRIVSDMIRIEPVTLELLDVYRETRLAALKETPLAFGSTFAGESRFTTAQWVARVTRSTTDAACTYLAFDGNVCCGLAGAFRDEDHPGRATLVSMWVAPSHRRRGIGETLVSACVDWCRSRSLESIDLLVTDWNTGAMALYERLGFRMTGQSEPYPNDPKHVEYQMARKV